MKKWKDIINHEGLYRLSDDGDVIALARTSTYINKYGKKVTIHLKEKVLTKQMTRKGYFTVPLRKDGKVKVFKVHRLVAIHFIPNPDNLPCVNHIDGNKQNNNYKNLEWCTSRDNTLHSISTGLRHKSHSHHSIGEVVNNFKILDKSIETTAEHKVLYTIQCLDCGKIMKKMASFLDYSCPCKFKDKK